MRIIKKTKTNTTINALSDRLKARYFMHGMMTSSIKYLFNNMVSLYLSLYIFTKKAYLRLHEKQTTVKKTDKIIGYKLVAQFTGEILHVLFRQRIISSRFSKNSAFIRRNTVA